MYCSPQGGDSNSSSNSNGNSNSKSNTHRNNNNNSNSNSCFTSGRNLCLQIYAHGLRGYVGASAWAAPLRKCH